MTAANDAGANALDGAVDTGDATEPQDASPADGPIDATLPFDAPGDAPADVMLDAASDASVTCGPQEQANRWALMDLKPIILPRQAAGLNLHAPDAGILTLPQAEAILCKSMDAGDLAGNGRRFATWGSHQEVSMEYDPATLEGDELALAPGYEGTLQFHSPDGSASYTIAVNAQIKKNGQPFSLDVGWTGAGFDAEIDELYRGLIATFAPSVPLDPAGTTCVSTGKCSVQRFQPNAGLWVDAVGFSLWVDDATAAPSLPSGLQLL